MSKAEPTYESVKEFLDYLNKRLFNIQNYYHVYSELGLHYNKAIDEEAAKAYLSVINRHKGFFVPVQESLRASLTLELCSFISTKEQKYKSRGKVVKDLKQLPDGPDLSGKYKQLLSKNANVIVHIDKFRNQYYAHKSFSDLDKLPPSNDKEFQELFADINELLSEADAFFENAVYFTDDAVDDTRKLGTLEN